MDINSDIFKPWTELLWFSNLRGMLQHHTLEFLNQIKTIIIYNLIFFMAQLLWIKDKRSKFLSKTYVQKVSVKKTITCGCDLSIYTLAFAYSIPVLKKEFMGFTYCSY